MERKPRALISVFSKEGIVEFATELVALGWELVASGGTARELRQAGLEVIETTEITGYPAILGHRVVTMHPKLHGGILADLSNGEHLQDMADWDIDPIDMVVGNLYDFEEKPGIDQIDIGGPALLRGAAKNFERLIVVIDPDNYDDVIAQLRQGPISLDARRKLAKHVFAHTAAYEALIFDWFDEQCA
jgi:phosphoribosylaminoimidazolecarboxamide formyltransferase/IMP cyclohydrolase